MSIKELQLKLETDEVEKILEKIDILLKEVGGGTKSFFNSKGHFDVADLNIYFKGYTYKEFMSWLILNYDSVNQERLVKKVDSYADEVTLYILKCLEGGAGEYTYYFEKSGLYLQDPLIDGDYTIDTLGSLGSLRSFKLYISFGGPGGSLITCKASFKFDLYKAAADWVEGGVRHEDGGFTINVTQEDLESVIDDVVGACITPRKSTGKGYPVYSLVMAEHTKDGIYGCYEKEVPILKI